MIIPGNEIRITQEVKVYENKYGRLYDDKVEFLPQKTKGTYVRWSWNAPYSIAVLPITSSGKLVLLKSFRHSARKFILEVPKGFGENDMEPIEIARRELVEESGLLSENLEYKGMVVTDPAFSYHPMYLFIAWNCLEGEANKEDSEVIFEKISLDIQRVENLFSEGIIQDAVTLLLIQMTKQLLGEPDEK